MYLAYTYATSQIAYSKAASSPIFQIQMNGVYFNKAFCNYAGNDTVTSCPPTNCQLATCNSRNIQANYGADYCTGQTATGPTPANTVGCGIQASTRRRFHCIHDGTAPHFLISRRSLGPILTA